jgi:WhiB family transcriptional regulator, redox-sensing transcriptional regulator
MVLKLRYPAPNNWREAKCGTIGAGREYDPFFDGPEEEALEFCNDNGTCPIRDECLLFALTNNCKEGVWGGMTELDRKALRKRWPLRSGKDPRPEWQWLPPGEAAEGLDQEVLRQELEWEQQHGEE